METDIRNLKLEFGNESTTSKMNAPAESTAGPSKELSEGGNNDEPVIKSVDGFPHFSELPKELQLQIWGLAASARIIKFTKQGRGRENRHFGAFDIQASKSISSTCKAAREVVARTYNLQITIPSHAYSKTHTKLVAFNSEKDILYLGITKHESLESVLPILSSSIEKTSHNQSDTKEPLLSTIKHVALPWVVINERHARILNRIFPQLQSLMLFLPVRQALWPKEVRKGKDEGILPGFDEGACEVGDILGKAKMMRGAFERVGSKVVVPEISLRWIFDGDER